MDRFRIGTRDSRLAVIQAEMVADALRQRGIDARLVRMKTTGDVVLDRPLAQIGGKGLFVRELDRALLEHRTDLSVHSLKDVPVYLDERLPIVGYSRREDPRDVLVLPEGVSELEPEKPIGCSSRRRIMQAKKLLPGMRFESVRGNVNTRLQKLDEGRYSALILAAAGLKRLGLSGRISRYFEVAEMIPSAGQGILALQGRSGEDYSLLEHFFDNQAAAAAVCERAYVRRIGGDCTLPVAAYAEVKGDSIVLTGMYACKEDEERFVTGQVRGSVQDGEMLASQLADRLMAEYHT